MNKPMQIGKTYGQIGYERYARSTGGKTWDGKPMPTWDQILERTPHVARAWEDAAHEIIEEFKHDG